MTPWIILDRDGVINHDSEHYIKSPDEWHPIDKSLEAIALLNQKGYQVAVATNQSGIARGLYTEETLQAIHQKMRDLLVPFNAKIKTIVFCPHIDSDHCDCRKPKPGLLNQIANTHQINLKDVPFVGDSWRDIQAGMSVQAKSVLVLTGYGQQTFKEHQSELENTLVCQNLFDFASTQKAIT